VTIISHMRGLFSLANWRTLIAGVIFGYIFAWKMHWAAQFWSLDKGWVEERIPVLTPDFGYHD